MLARLLAYLASRSIQIFIISTMLEKIPPLLGSMWIPMVWVPSHCPHQFGIHNRHNQFCTHPHGWVFTSLQSHLKQLFLLMFLPRWLCLLAFRHSVQHLGFCFSECIRLGMEASYASAPPQYLQECILIKWSWWPGLALVSLGWYLLF